MSASNQSQAPAFVVGIARADASDVHLDVYGLRLRIDGDWQLELGRDLERNWADLTSLLR